MSHVLGLASALKILMLVHFLVRLLLVD